VSDCPPQAAGTGVPRWLRGRHAGLWACVVWLVPLLAEPAAHATDADPQWPVWLLLAVVAGSFVATAVLGSATFVPGQEARHPWAAAALLAVQAVASVAVVAGSPESSLLFSLLAIAGVVALSAAPALWWVAGSTGLGVAAVVGGDGTGDQVAATALVTVLSGLGCWAFRRLFAVIGELGRTREELARAAVAQERERFSRDLHDLLGHTLSVIVVKAQAARRMAELDPAAAAGHAGDIETIGRRALTEVRQAVAGYAGRGLAAEVDEAVRALTAAGAAVSVHRAEGPLPPEVDALFGWVVREGVTNVVRHASARTCRIAWSVDGPAARLTITDDGQGATHPAAAPSAGGPGVSEPGGGGPGADGPGADGPGADGPGADGPGADGPGGGGRGLAGLRERVAAAGGRLEVASAAGGGFRLAVEVPAGVREAVGS
jgi:two-component system sensor histidine kinase DesK